MEREEKQRCNQSMLSPFLFFRLVLSRLSCFRLRLLSLGRKAEGRASFGVEDGALEGALASPPPSAFFESEEDLGKQSVFRRRRQSAKKKTLSLSSSLHSSLSFLCSTPTRKKKPWPRSPTSATASRPLPTASPPSAGPRGQEEATAGSPGEAGDTAGTGSGRR